MATEITLQHPSGITKQAYVGWSWTSFFFGCFPAMFRGDWLGFFVHVGVSIVLAVTTMGIGNLVFAIAWCIFYNKWHTRRLLENGYVMVGVGPSEESIKAKLNMNT